LKPIHQINANISKCTLTNVNGIEADILSYGATLTSLRIPTKDGKIIDVVLGFETAEQYVQTFEKEGSPYFGAVVGRYAGRIKNGNFMLNDQSYQVEKNLNHQHHLHGGKHGLSMAYWKMMDYSTDGKSSAVKLQYNLKEEDDLFPGDLLVTVMYTLTEKNELKITYQAISTQDTILNLTQHSYFNLDGHDGDVQNQMLQINAAKILATDAELIPNGSFIELSDHPFNFANPKPCPDSIDTSFVLTENVPVIATLFSMQNQLRMHVYTDQPSIQLEPGIKGKQDVVYHSTSGICFEAQHFPDSPNHNIFPTTLLKKGENYHQTTIFKFEI